MEVDQLQSPKEQQGKTTDPKGRIFVFQTLGGENYQIFKSTEKCNKILIVLNFLVKDSFNPNLCLNFSKFMDGTLELHPTLGNKSFGQTQKWIIKIFGYIIFSCPWQYCVPM